MKEIVVVYLPWLISCVTIWMILWAGDKRRSAWVVGVFAQALWVVWIIASRSWGLVPLNVAMFLTCIRNYRKWGEEE